MEKKIINEIKRVSELMGVKNSLISEASSGPIPIRSIIMNIPELRISLQKTLNKNIDNITIDDIISVIKNKQLDKRLLDKFLDDLLGEIDDNVLNSFKTKEEFGQYVINQMSIEGRIASLMFDRYTNKFPGSRLASSLKNTADEMIGAINGIKDKLSADEYKRAERVLELLKSRKSAGDPELKGLLLKLDIDNPEELIRKNLENLVERGKISKEEFRRKMDKISSITDMVLEKGGKVGKGVGNAIANKKALWVLGTLLSYVIVGNWACEYFSNIKEIPLWRMLCPQVSGSYMVDKLTPACGNLSEFKKFVANKGLDPETAKCNDGIYSAKMSKDDEYGFDYTYVIDRKTFKSL
jgi:hypothetical protein